LKESFPKEIFLYWKFKAVFPCVVLYWINLKNSPALLVPLGLRRKLTTSAIKTCLKTGFQREASGKLDYHCGGFHEKPYLVRFRACSEEKGRELRIKPSNRVTAIGRLLLLVRQP
jgi:hypothetical protein